MADRVKWLLRDFCCAISDLCFFSTFHREYPLSFIERRVSENRGGIRGAEESDLKKAGSSRSKFRARRTLLRSESEYGRSMQVGREP